MIKLFWGSCLDVISLKKKLKKNFLWLLCFLKQYILYPKSQKAAIGPKLC